MITKNVEEKNMENKKNVEKKPFYKSKTKWAAILIGISPILMTVGGMLQGSLDYGTGFMQLSAEVGIILGIFGIRDLPFINKK